MAILSIDKVGEEQQKRTAERLARRAASGNLWPKEWSDTPEGAWEFVKAQWTWNEAEKEVQPMPNLDYLKRYTYEWFEGYKSGRCLITEKCRRMVISWCARALELHQMGLGRCDQILCGEDLLQAAKHVYRLKYLYEGLQSRQPQLKLPACSDLKFEGESTLKQFSLPNGSTCMYANGQAGKLQGSGVSIITLEEFGTYRYAASMLGQAQIITQGSAKAVGGFVNVITNASIHPEWQRIKNNK